MNSNGLPSVFQVKTLSLTETTLQAGKEFSIHCASSHLFIIIASCKRVSIFKEDSFEQLWAIQTDEDVCCISLTDDSFILLVAEVSGQFQLFHIPSKTFLWRHNCKKAESALIIEEAFFIANPLGFLEVYILTKEKFVLEFSNIPVSSLYNEVESGNLQAIFDGAHLEEFDLPALYPEHEISNIFQTFSNSPSIGLGIRSIVDALDTSFFYAEDIANFDFRVNWEYNPEEKNFFWCFDFSAYGNAIKVVNTRDGKYLVFLNEQNFLNIMCSLTSTICKTWSYPDKEGCITNFIMNETIDTSSQTYFNDFSLKAVFEALPKARLMNLISRRKFVEAEKLAELSSINSEVIHETKINYILNNLTMNRYDNSSKVELNNMWNELEEAFAFVKDVEFIKSAVSYPLSDVNYLKKLLLYVQTWLINHHSMKGTQEIIAQVNQDLNKLITYEILSSNISTCLILKDFLNKDLLNYMILELKNGSLNTVLIIWQRHKDELLLSINIEILKEIVTAVPDSVTSKYLIPFLCDDFLPSIFARNPESFDVVAEWLIHRVHLIELSEKDLWPENGLALVSGFFKVIEDMHEKNKRGLMSFSASLSLSMVHKKIASADFPVGRLAEVLKDLTWLMTLKCKFCCKISLSDFKDSKMDVIFAVLDRVNLLDVSKVVEDFARPFALENDLELDVCLKLYIMRTLKTSCFTWWSWDEEPWEERLVTVLENIISVDCWVNTALMIVGRANVPWSERMQILVQKGIECDCKRKEEFLMQSKLIGLKEVLLKYDLKNFRINNDVNMLYVLVNYIFKQNRVGVLEDVKKVLMSINDQISESNVYFKFLQFALNQNKVDHVIEIFLSLSRDIAITCALRLLRYIKLYIDDRYLLQEQKELRKSMLYVGVYLIEFLRKTKKYFIEEELLIPFRSLVKLEDEFGICMTFSEITSKSQCQAIIESAIHDFLTKKGLFQKVIDTAIRKHAPVSSNISRLNRLGDILLFERYEILTLLITNCLQEQKYNLVLLLCNEMTVSFATCETAQIFMQVVEHLYLNFRSIKDFSFGVMIETIYHLTSMAVTYCKDDLIEKYMPGVHLSSYLSSIKEISRQHSLVIAPEFTVDSYHKWKFYPFYCDEGFQLDYESTKDFVMLIIQEFVKQPNVTFTEVAPSEHNKLLKYCKQIVGHMIERGHGIAAFKTLFFYYHVKIKNLNFATEEKDLTIDINSSVFSDIGSVMFSVAQRVLSQRKVDLFFIYNLFSVLPQDSQFASLEVLLKWSTNDLKRLTVVARIGMELAKSTEKVDILSMYENIYKKAYLLSRNNIKSVTTEAIFSSSHETKWAVVKDVIYTHHIDLPTLFDFSAAFQLPSDKVLIVYLNSIFKKCEKNYLTCESMDYDISSTLRRAETIIKSIRNEEFLYNNFQNLMKKTSPYSYDILLFIVEQLHTLSADIRTINSGCFEKEIKVLKFLKVYKRTSPVTELEQNEWKLLHPTDPKLPSIALKHLPFHFFLKENPHVIINPELTVDTLEVWLKIATILKIPEDHLIIIAVKNSVVNYLSRRNSPRILLNPDVRFVFMINNIIGKIKVLESSVACASWVANKMPPGGNKVSFATMAVNYAQQWHEQSSDSVINIYNKLIYLKQQSAIERIVYKNNLAADKILSLKYSPLQLMEYLIENFTSNIDQSIKACKAVLEIGEIVEIDLTSVLLKYILKWSSVSQNTSSYLDETFSCLSPVVNHWEHDENVDEKNALRLINLLLSLPESLLPSLYKILKDNFQVMQNNSQIMLFCFVAVFDVYTVAKALDWDAEILESYLIPLKCSIGIQNLNLPYSFPMFMKCSKTELVQRILSGYFNNPKAVVFCIQLCLEYNIWDAAIWEAILQRIITKSKDYSLQDIIQSTQSHLIHMWHTDVFIDAWKCILSGILRMKITDSASLLCKLYKAILRCPCISSLDVNFFTHELSCVIQTFDDETVKEVERITNMPSFVTNLMKIVENHSDES
ncbi:kinetochore-associated protein 1 [Nephila pilipes]|uniref:Kinetochore-associated protein 1 n=1 Tax=Nephila pilipes TaxID=299642 RepID=A0A8X6PUY9_NEPPI|nr:kinetochore-associated protein 1 [Nephila pilipes]